MLQAQGSQQQSKSLCFTDFCCTSPPLLPVTLLLRRSLVRFNSKKHQTYEKKYISQFGSSFKSIFPIFIHFKTTQRETDRCSLSLQDHRPDSPLEKEKKKKNPRPYHESLISQMPLYFSLNGDLGTNRPGRGPIQIRLHSLHHQSTPLQHRSFSLHSQCSWSQQLPPSPSASRSLRPCWLWAFERPHRRGHSCFCCTSLCRPLIFPSTVQLISFLLIIYDR